MQTQIRRRRMRVSTVCLHKVLLKFELKCKIPPNNQGLVQFITVANSITWPIPKLQHGKQINQPTTYHAYIPHGKTLKNREHYNTKQQVSITRECHSHTPKTKQRHHEEETQNTNSHTTASTQLE